MWASQVIPEDEGPAQMAAPADMPPGLPAHNVYHPDPDDGVLQALVESMMPWNHVPPDNSPQPDPDEAAEVDALFD